MLLTLDFKLFVILTLYGFLLSEININFNKFYSKIVSSDPHTGEAGSRGGVGELVLREQRVLVCRPLVPLSAGASVRLLSVGLAVRLAGVPNATAWRNRNIVVMKGFLFRMVEVNLDKYLSQDQI